MPRLRSLTETRLPRSIDRGGRPSKYTAPRVLLILLALDAGQRRAGAARCGGVASSTLHEWMRRGRAGEAAFEPFVMAVERAERRARRSVAGFKYLRAIPD